MPANSGTERTLGIILGKLEGIEDRLDRGDESRGQVHKRLDELVLRTTHLESDVSSIKVRTDDMQTVTDDVKKMQQKALGAGTLGSWLVRIGIGVVTLAGWIVGAYTYMTGRPPP